MCSNLTKILINFCKNVEPTRKNYILLIPFSPSPPGFQISASEGRQLFLHPGENERVNSQNQLTSHLHGQKIIPRGVDQFEAVTDLILQRLTLLQDLPVDLRLLLPARHSDLVEQLLFQ